MNNKRNDYWLVLTTVISLLFTGYLWLMPGSLVKPVAEWVSAIGTVAAVVVSLWLQFRNEKNASQDKREQKKMAVARTLLDQLAVIDNQLSDTIKVLTDEYHFISEIEKSYPISTPEVQKAINDSKVRAETVKHNLIQVYSNNWQLNYLISEIMSDEDISNFGNLKQEIYQTIILQINNIQSYDELGAFLSKGNFYTVVNKMREFILNKYYIQQ